ncbi:hypothetical protein NB717_003125 [Xanthomonas sacchari]|uniref:energy transducer TonB n=1 Tax=Xanthomonas sacchari TaxID=56458 RepID=UPI002254A0CE|nr:energy transducer TonB [Xanthomonas sacchari]MCW0396587.1 hypothetical protein [Xanthomonas sacchari]MCW0446150.1 hypothetical protein [Xanthomonas sacchari]MCW0462057.1 hypothetical protein [Xanthomonas sacchari]
MRYVLSSLLLAFGACFCTAAWAEDPVMACRVNAQSQQAWPAPFPQFAASAGTVVLDVVVDDGGHVSDARVRTGSGQALLDAAAQRAVRRWTFECPAQAPPVASIAVDYTRPDCSVDLTSKNMNPPKYPAAALAARQQGDVYVEMRPRTLDASSEVRLSTSSGNRDLDQAALVAAQKWRLTCTTPSSGNAWIEVPVRFALDTPSAPSRGTTWKTPMSEKREADPVSIPYARVADAAKDLPRETSLKNITPAGAAPGMSVYQSTPQAVRASKDYTVVNWIVFLPPHPLAPSLVRYTTSADFSSKDAATERKVRGSRLCEAPAMACQRLDAQLEKLLSGSR